MSNPNQALADLCGFARRHGIPTSYARVNSLASSHSGTGIHTTFGPAAERRLWVWWRLRQVTGFDTKRPRLADWLALATTHDSGWLISRGGPPRWRPDPPRPEELADGRPLIAIPVHP